MSRKPGCDLSAGRHISEVGRAWHLRPHQWECPAILLREVSGSGRAGANLLLGRAAGVNDPESRPGGRSGCPLKRGLRREPHRFAVSLVVRGSFQSSVRGYVQYSKEGTSLKSEICGRKLALEHL